VKGFSDNRFFNLLARLQVASNPHPTIDRWSFDGVDWRRERQSHWGQDYAYQVEAQTLTHTGRPAWSLLVIGETWWGPDRKLALRQTHWGRLVSSSKTAALAWFNRHER